MTNLTNPYTFRIVRDLCEATILRWVNNFGGYETFPFTGIPSTDTEIMQGQVMQTEDQRVTVPISKPSQEIMTLRTGRLSHGQFKGLQSLYSSPRVYIIHPRGSGQAPEPVYVLPGTFTTEDEFEMTHEVEFKIQKGFINALTN